MEVSGLADGDYLLETVVDPDAVFVETSTSNNCGGVLIRLTNLATAAPAVELLGNGPACP